jgi:hypothetical protein
MYKLTTEQNQALSSIWDTIGSDYLSIAAENGESTVSRGEVIEVVLDAGRPKQMFPNVDWTDFDALTYPLKVKAAKQAFTYTRYGY